MQSLAEGRCAPIIRTVATEGAGIAELLQAVENHAVTSERAPPGAVDVAEASGATYVGIASCGFDSDANRIANEAKLIRGNLVYLYAGLRTLLAWKHATFVATVDGERHTFRGYGVAVANSKAYGGGMYLVPQAQLDDGLLDVMLITESPKLNFLKGMGKVFKGAHVDDPATAFVRGTEVEISADRPFTVYADGDPIADLPVTIRVAPQVLRVIVPAP